MPKLTEQQIEGIQPALKLMFERAPNIKPNDYQTSEHADHPLVSGGFSNCTGMVVLYHKTDGSIEPTLCHISSPYLGKVYGFLNTLSQRVAKEGGHVEAVCVTGKQSMGEVTGTAATRYDSDATGIINAVREVIPDIDMKDTIFTDSSGFLLAYVPPKHSVEGFICTHSCDSQFITPYFPFETRGRKVANKTVDPTLSNRTL